jgi:hypothetical protein
MPAPNLDRSAYPVELGSSASGHRTGATQRTASALTRGRDTGATRGQALKDAKRDDIEKSIEDGYEHILAERVDYIEYGDPDKLSAGERAKLNCALLKQVLIHLPNA